MHDPRDTWLGEIGVGEHREVRGTGEVASVVVTRGGGVARAAHAELGGLVVHARDEGLDRTRQVLGERYRGVIAGRKHQAVEHRLQAYVLAEREHPDLRAARGDGGARH